MSERRDLFGDLRGAAGFLTPLGPEAVPTPRALDWFPVVGAAVGALVGLVWWGADRVWPPAVAAAVVVVADLVLTGLLHVDGLADTADGLLPPLPRARRLAVMRDPAVGAFGLVAVVAVLLLRFSSLVVLPPDVGVVAGLWCASRAAMATVVRAVPYAREGDAGDGTGRAPGGAGLASVFRDGDGDGGGGAPSPAAARVAFVGAALALWLAGVGEGGAGVAAVAAAAVAFAGVVALAVRRVGGFTGDILGAAGVVAETVGLLVVAGR